jgi:hypothetical protein
LLFIVALASLPQAFYEAVKCPYILPVLRTAVNIGTQTKVGTINCLCLSMLVLRKKQRAKRVSWWVHPWPWLRIVKLVTAPHTFPQMPKGSLVIAFVIFQLTKHHRLTDAQNGKSRIVEEFAVG